MLFSPPTFAQDEESSWVDGPATVDIGDNLAELDFDEAYSFTGAEETQMIMEMMGNQIDGSEVGMLIPSADDESWFLIFEYDESGYIPDDEKDELDADAILSAISEGTEAANEYRVERGFTPIHVSGWYNEPFYDDQTNNLTWSILAESEEEYGVNESVNHNVRILGRGGYMSVVLVADPADLERLIPEAQTILSGFSYKSGNKYAEYVQGDKLAGYGLTALVAGGVGAAAAKTGLLQLIFKNIKFVLIAALAFLGGIWKWVKRFLMGRDQYAVEMPDQSNMERVMESAGTNSVTESNRSET